MLSLQRNTIIKIKQNSDTLQKCLDKRQSQECYNMYNRVYKIMLAQ